MGNNEVHLVTIGEVHPFPNAKCNMEQALKILEESAEVFCSWQDYDKSVNSLLVSTPYHQSLINRNKERLLGECADLIMACTNLIYGALQTVADSFEVGVECRLDKYNMRFLTLVKAAEVWNAEMFLCNNASTAIIARDLIENTCEIITQMGVTDFRPYMEACEKRNLERGRYGDKRDKSLVGKAVAMRVVDECPFPVPTGRLIKEYLVERGITQKDLAHRIDVSEAHISSLINGKRRLNVDMALKLERVMPDVSAGYWLNHEAKYREYIAREKEGE